MDIKREPSEDKSDSEVQRFYDVPIECSNFPDDNIDLKQENFDDADCSFEKVENDLIHIKSEIDNEVIVIKEEFVDNAISLINNENHLPGCSNPKYRPDQISTQQYFTVCYSKPLDIVRKDTVDNNLVNNKIAHATTDVKDMTKMHSEILIDEQNVKKEVQTLYLQKEVRIILRRVTYFPRNFICKDCCGVFGSLNHLNSHCILCTKSKQIGSYETHTGEKLHQCDVCFKKFLHFRNLIKHKIIHDKKPLQCEVCYKFFQLNSVLKKHKMTHTNEKPHQCDVCFKKFLQFGNLKIHKIIHSDEKPLQCDVCFKYFQRNGDLKKHKMTHTGEKPHQCDVCFKSFLQISNLKTHKMTHTGEKPHQCDVCFKNFLQFNNLKIHKMTHTNDKPLQCDVCFKFFQRNNDLKIHKMTHTGEKPHQCDVCFKRFLQISNLKRHKITHAVEKPHQCEVCEYKCWKLGYLKMHYKLRHSIGKP